MAISQFTKAPTFVSNHQDVMGMLDSYDKEFQRINQDYTTASTAIGQYRKSIDILKMPVKNYFDNKYNEAVSNFSSNIDLTKRGQLYKTQNLLDSITMDPIIKNGIQSTNNFRKIQEFRQKINTDPKYAKARNAANEWVEQQEQEAYLRDDSLTASYTRTTPIITLNADEHYKGVLSKLPYEEKIYSDGTSNVFSKVKGFQQGTDAVFKEISSNPDVIAAERNNFAYQYQTPEARANFAKNFEANRRTNISNINTSLADIAKILTVQNPEYHAAEIAQLKQQESNLLAQKRFLETHDASNPEQQFQAYLYDKAFSYGISNISTKETKIEVDKARKFFADENQRTFTNRLNLDKFKETQAQNKFNNNLKTLEFGLKQRVTEAKEKEAGVGVEDVNTEPYFRTSDNPVEYTPEIFNKEQNELKKQNLQSLKNIELQVNSFPGHKLNQYFNKWVSAGIVNGKRGLRSDKDILNAIKIKEQILEQYIGTNTPIPPNVQVVVNELNNIQKNNTKYKINEELDREARRLSGYKNEGGFFSAVGMDKQENDYRARLKGFMDIRDQTLSVPIKNLTFDSEKGKNRNELYLIEYARNQNGLIDSKGKRFKFSSSPGGEKDLSGDTLLDNKFLDSVDWIKSVGAIEVKNGQPVVRLDLKPKGDSADSKIAGDNFKDRVAYVPIKEDLAQALLNKAGQGKFNIYKMKEPSNIYDRMQALEISDQKRNSILANKGGIFDLEQSTFGGFHALIKPLSINGTYQINYDFGKLGTIVARSRNPERFNEVLKESSDKLVQILKQRGMFTPENFKLELERAIPGIENSVN